MTPGRTGEHLGLPVFPTVRSVCAARSFLSGPRRGANISTHAQAAEQLKPDATAVYVAAHQATAAIEEAIEAEIPLIVAVAEHIPLHDMLRVSTAIVADLGYIGFPPHSDRSRSNPCLNRNPNPASSAPTRLASSLLWGDAG